MDMPKIIEGLEGKILFSAREIIENEGYDALSMKELAKRNDIAVGTIYNYYPDKNSLLIALVVDDWLALEKSIEDRISALNSFEEGIHLLYLSFMAFSAEHQILFTHFSTNGNSAYYESYRSFVNEGAKILEKLAEHFGVHYGEDRYQMAASMFSYAIHYPDTPYQDIEDAIKRIL